MIKRLKRMFAVLLVCTFVVSSYVAWSGFTGREPVPIPEVLGGGPIHITGTDSDVGDLDVIRAGDDMFAGSISIENPTDNFQDVLVTVDLFDGDQNVGELFGTVTGKPGTASTVDLFFDGPLRVVERCARRPAAIALIPAPRHSTASRSARDTQNWVLLPDEPFISIRSRTAPGAFDRRWRPMFMAWHAGNCRVRVHGRGRGVVPR